MRCRVVSTGQPMYIEASGHATHHGLEVDVVDGPFACGLHTVSKRGENMSTSQKTEACCPARVRTKAGT